MHQSIPLGMTLILLTHSTGRLLFPVNQSIHHIPPSQAVWNLGVTIDNHATFSDRVASVSLLCRFALFNIRKINLFLTQHELRPSNRCTNIGGDTASDDPERRGTSGLQTTESGPTLSHC